MNYRSDIDGLRTIAVFLVIFNHVGFSFFTGGFVGVDVFFVISGFLITSIIHPRIQQKTFSFAWFISRRVKRLMPVLFAIIFITMGIFTLVMLPQDLIKFYKSIIWVVFYAGNIFFWREHGGYFDGGSQEAPLLHTWSLAVEEQYYFIWPLLLAAAYRYFGKKIALYVSIALCIAATVFSQWGTEVTIGAAYYLLPTRFFELLVGSCLALMWSQLPKANQITNHILSIVGLLLIIVSALVLTEHHSFPGYNALYPVIGTALIIYASSGIVNKFLSLKPMVFSGNISYSLYLWHWPILVFARYTSVDFTLVNQISFIILTYILAILSWRYIEQPFRNFRADSFKAVATKLYIVPSSILIVLIGLGVFFDGYKNRFPSKIVAMEHALHTHTSKSRIACHSPYRNSKNSPESECIFGNKTTDKQQANVFVFGDSHANHMVPFIQTLTEDANLLGQDYTLDRCLPIFDLKWGSTIHLAEKCKSRNMLAENHIQENSFDFVIMAASWPGFNTRRIFNDERLVDNQKITALLQQKLTQTINAIIDSCATPIMFEDIPTLRGKSPKCPIKQKVFNEKLNCEIQHDSNELFNQLTTTLKGEFPQLIVISPHQLMCIDNNCLMTLNDIPLYRDEDHLNEIGSALLGGLFLEKNSNPFKSKYSKNISRLSVETTK